MTSNPAPVRTAERYILLDVLRGIALLGICLANFPEFSLYTFQKKEVVAAMPTATADHIWRWLHYIFIDGKFYTIFSLLFGVGFSIIIANLAKKNLNEHIVFYRRMIALAVIGLLHMLLLWAGDILLLYALVGMLLPLFRKVTDRRLLVISVVLLVFPVVIDFFRVCTAHRYNLVHLFAAANQYFNERSGITPDNFPVWLLEKQSYADVLKFNLSGSFIRCIEFVEGNRVFKVLGLFLLGLYIGRQRMYARLDDFCGLLLKLRNVGFFIGLPLSILLAWSEMNGRPLGIVFNSAIYTLSVVPLSLGYVSLIAMHVARSGSNGHIYRLFASTGRMALTHYIGQSAAGMVVFYGIGFHLALCGLVHAELIAFGVFIMLLVLSNLWLQRFRFGPLEWLWRMVTYWSWLKIRK